MKNILAICAVALFLAGCASKGTGSPVLFQAYSQYSEVANEDNIDEVAPEYFSQALLGDDYQDNPDAAGQLLFKNYMSAIDGHHEERQSSNGCLTINGYDEDKAPLIFSLKYILTSGRWLIDDIHVVFVENTDDFSSEAKCPSEYEN